MTRDKAVENPTSPDSQLAEEIAAEITKARALMRRAVKVTMASEYRSGLKAPDAPGGAGPVVEGSYPYASLTKVAFDHDGTPLLLLSDLADHSANLKANPRAGLLFDGTMGYRDPLAGGRVALIGRVEPCDDSPDENRLRQRYLSRHVASELYAAFADFRLYRYHIEGAHLIGGFAKAMWVSAEDLLLDCADSAELAEAEPQILAHMNADHADAIAAIAKNTLKLPTAKWRMAGIDPEGWDLYDGRNHARCPFDAKVTNAAEARKALVAQAKAARAQS